MTRANENNKLLSVPSLAICAKNRTRSRAMSQVTRQFLVQVLDKRHERLNKLRVLHPIFATSNALKSCEKSCRQNTAASFLWHVTATRDSNLPTRKRQRGYSPQLARESSTFDARPSSPAPKTGIPTRAHNSLHLTSLRKPLTEAATEMEPISLSC